MSITNKTIILSIIVQSVVDNDNQHTDIQHNNNSNVTLSMISITNKNIMLIVIMLSVVDKDTQQTNIQRHNKSNMTVSIMSIASETIILSAILLRSSVTRIRAKAITN
jgi:hypothetical protein